MGKLKEHSNSFAIFQIIGFILGGIAPVFLGLLWALFNNDYEIIAPQQIIPFLAYSGLGLLIGFGALAFDKYIPKFKGVYLTCQAIYSIMFIHLLVLYTGSAKTSVFAMSYLYLPAIVAYTHGRGRELWGAVFFLFISYCINLYFSEWQFIKLKWLVTNEHFNPKDYTENRGNVIYLLVFLIQITVTSVIGSKASLSYNNEVSSKDE